MDLEIKKIIDLHRLDQLILEIEEMKGNLPSLVKEQENKIDTCSKSIKDAENNILLIEKEINAFNDESADFTSKIEKYNSQIYSVKNNKEYEALLKEIDFFKNKYNDISIKLNSKVQEKSDLINLNKEINEQLNELTKQLEINISDLKETSALTDKEEKELNKNKDKIIKEIKNKKFLESYLEGNHSFKLAVVSRNSCDECNSSLPPQFILNIKKMDQLYKCPNCGINLYWDE